MRIYILHQKFLLNTHKQVAEPGYILDTEASIYNISSVILRGLSASTRAYLYLSMKFDLHKHKRVTNSSYTLGTEVSTITSSSSLYEGEVPEQRVH